MSSDPVQQVWTNLHFPGTSFFTMIFCKKMWLTAKKIDCQKQINFFAELEQNV